MRTRLATATIVLLLLPSFAGTAAATPYTDLAAFTAAAGPLTLVDFNAAPSGDIGATYAAVGVTFSPDNRFGQCLTFTTSPPGCWVSGVSEAEVFEASFTVSGITAVGLNNARNAGFAELRLYDSASNLLEMVSSDALTDTMDFFGVITSAPIARITVTYPTSPLGWAVDDLRFGTAVPEPSTLLLLGLGIASLSRSARRRKRAQA